IQYDSHISFSVFGQDDTGGSGMKDFEVWASEVGGEYRLVSNDNQIGEIFTFQGAPGKNYCLVPVLRDNVNNQTLLSDYEPVCFTTPEVEARLLNFYSLQTEVTGQGTIQILSDAVAFSEGKEVTVKAIPENGWRFENWDGDLTGSDAEINLVMDGNKSIRANFVATDVETGTFTLQFSPGWNLFSTPFKNDSTDLLDLFQPLIGNGSLVKIQDEQGKAMEDFGHSFGGWRNNIGEINATEGYKLRVTDESELEVSGSPVDYPFLIPLNAGWNIIGHPHIASIDAIEIVKPLIDNGTLVKIQDEKGYAIEDWGTFGGWQNNIGDFEPGKGYKVRVNANTALTVNSSYPKSTVLRSEKVATRHFAPDFVGNGSDHMNFNIVGFPENLIHWGDELAVFDGEVCVGAISITDHQLISQKVSIAVSAADEFGLPGFTEGNSITLKLWSSMENQEYVLEPEILKGSSTFVKHESTWLSLEKYATTGLDDLIFTNDTEINSYPNPFSHEITIEINMSNAAEVKVAIFNQLGQKIKTLVERADLPDGTNRLMWNGRNENQQKVNPGMYHLQIIIDGKYHYKKIVYTNH
ncbi:MAG: T9SS type A sorting domain-containing protein, partial [Bacteroidales bacterium]|nr:T9SS type A sorting domain-containing protein [Bacteroidales bacterium]